MTSTKLGQLGYRAIEAACDPTDTDSVPIGLELLAAVLLPTAAGGAVIGVVRGWRWAAERRRARAPRPAQPIERLAADLRRLHAQLDAMENLPGTPGKALRVRALRDAYVDALTEACLRLDIAAPRPAGSDRAGIYRIEAALRSNGLDVRHAAPR